ncbi:MAG: DUF4837 family protein [Candidatus Cloacimonetes bacterium]|nr:DUF4837 family protein [Candidatus Cloacimonadota bacterium]
MKHLVIISLLILFIFGCSKSGEKYNPKVTRKNLHKPYAWGHRQKIYIFADNNVWKYAEKPLRASLERFHFTTENEAYFQILRADYNAIDEFYKYNNLIFLSDYSSDQPVSKHVRSIMQKNVKDEIENNSVAIYPVDNLWANDQYVVFLIGDNEENLLKLNIIQSTKLFELFRKKFEDRIAIKTYGLDVYSASSFKSLPWKVKLPKKYSVYKKGDRFTSFMARSKERADRYFSVYYEEMPENNVTKEWMMEVRKKIAWDYYDEDFFKEEDVRQEKYKLSNHKGFKLSGRWQNLKYVVGGAFQSFAFYDSQAKIGYLIDNSVYFPEGFKLPALMELEIISKTFETKQK